VVSEAETEEVTEAETEEVFKKRVGEGEIETEDQ
jgi:hypothetical protein